MYWCGGVEVLTVCVKTHQHRDYFISSWKRKLQLRGIYQRLVTVSQGRREIGRTGDRPILVILILTDVFDTKISWMRLFSLQRFSHVSKYIAYV